MKNPKCWKCGTKFVYPEPIGYSPARYYCPKCYLINMEEEPKLTDDCKAVLKKRLADVKKGKVISTEELKRRLGF